MEKYMTPEELFHYGVLGMKWGVRKNPSKAFYKASKKAKKLRDKEVATNVKAEKLRSKAFKKETSATTTEKYNKAVELKTKANKLSLKSAKLKKKGDKWVKKMENEFKETKVSEISREHMDIGKKYAYMLRSETTVHVSK